MQFNQLFEIELRALIEHEIARIKDDLTTIGGVPDYSQYTNLVGQIAGLKLVLDDLCDLANAKTTER